MPAEDHSSWLLCLLTLTLAALKTVLEVGAKALANRGCPGHH